MADEIGNIEPSSPIAAKSDSEKPQASGADAAKAQASLKARKRTKTGCLTCRKRRIKCGEERPVCANCIKSKRTCEGYAPRVVFKDPHSTYPPGWTIPGYPYQPRPGLAGQYIRPHPNAAFSSQFPAIAPRPMPGQGEYFVAPNQIPPNWQQGQPVPSQGGYVLVPQVNYNPQLAHGYPPFTAPPTTVQQSPTYSETLMPVSQPDVGHIVTTGQPGITPQWLSNAVAHELASHQAPASVPSPVTPVSATPHNLPQPQIVQPSPTWMEEHEAFSEARHHYAPLDAAPTRSHPAIVPFHPESPIGDYDQAAVNTGHHHFANEMGNPGSSLESQQQPQAQENGDNEEEKIKPPLRQALLPEPTATIDEGEEDDDYYDVMSDEEELQDVDTTTGPPRKDVQHILTLANSRPEYELGSYHAFIDDPNALASYVPKYHNSPLMHAPTARIFCHFVAATGPLLSSYGRHTVNPALFFSGIRAPKSHQALWTYTIPTLALSNPALLQSMLALSSLQISRLQSTPLTIPMKHYQFALRKVARSVAVPSKRSSISTLAATLLLSHFEVISGEHAKWNSHLAGARQLLIEVDFKGMTRRIVEEKLRLASSVDVDWSRPYVNAQFQSYGDDLPWVPEPNSVDESVVSQMTGVKVKYERHGSIVDESNVTTSNGRLSEKEMDEYQTYRDLFWFYTKLDMIQALLRGRRLLYPFDRWAYCPPRGPIGRIDAVYGSLDHVHILLGRIAEFAGKDVIRKRKAIKMNGGVWKPPSGMFPTGPPLGQPPNAGPPIGMPPPTPSSMSSGGHSDSSNGPQRPTMPPGSGQPSFYGMMPDTGTTYDLPEAFASAPRENIYVPPSPDENFELATATAAAEEEWKSIQKALTIFENSLGPAFVPLADDAGPVIATPFGLALQYSTYQVALCWVMFYMGRIMSARSHPSMPPASMMASGVAAAQTAQWSNTIGRITFGMQTPPDDQPLNPAFGGAIAETMLPLFVAGVQYRDPYQRAYTIDRLHLIAERIGHDSAALIAAGLETVWIRQAEMGRGPKYDPTMRITDEHGENLVFDSVKSRQPPLGKSFTPRGKVEVGEVSINADKRSAVYLQADTKEFAAGLMAVEENLGSLDINGERR